MKTRTNLLDEMQEQTLLKIEHRGFQIAFAGLFAAIYIQLALGYTSFRSIGPELILLLVLSLYSLIATLRKGIWDRRFRPTFKTNLGLSLAAGFGFGLFWFLVSYRQYHRFYGSLAVFVFIFFFVSLLTLGLFSLSSAFYQHKQSQIDLQADCDETEE